MTDERAIDCATLKITISNDDGVVYDHVTMTLPVVPFNEQTDRIVLNAAVEDGDGDDATIAQLLHDAASWVARND